MFVTKKFNEKFKHTSSDEITSCGMQELATLEKVAVSIHVMLETRPYYLNDITYALISNFN